MNNLENQKLAYEMLNKTLTTRQKIGLQQHIKKIHSKLPIRLIPEITLQDLYTISNKMIDDINNNKIV